MQYTTNYSLKKPQYADEADIEIINDNSDDIDNLIHQNRTMIAPAFDSTKAYVIGDPVAYLGELFVFIADKAAGAWDATKVEPTTAAEIGSGGTEVVANPSGSATAELTKIDIGGTKYNTNDATARTQLNAMKTGFDGVTYQTPVAMVQGCDQKIVDTLSSAIIYNIRGVGTKSGGNSGISGNGQYFVHAGDKKLRVVSDYASVTNFTDTKVPFSDKCLYCYDGDLYICTVDNGTFDDCVRLKSFYGIEQIIREFNGAEPEYNFGYVDSNGAIQKATSGSNKYFSIITTGGEVFSFTGAYASWGLVFGVKADGTIITLVSSGTKENYEFTVPDDVVSIRGWSDTSLKALKLVLLNSVRKTQDTVRDQEFEVFGIQVSPSFGYIEKNGTIRPASSGNNKYYQIKNLKGGEKFTFTGGYNDNTWGTGFSVDDQGTVTVLFYGIQNGTTFTVPNDCVELRVWGDVTLTSVFSLVYDDSILAKVEKNSFTIPRTVVVDAAGNGDFTDIQDAFDYLNGHYDTANDPCIVYIMDGIYEVTPKDVSPFYALDKGANRISVIGQSRDNTIIRGTCSSEHQGIVLNIGGPCTIENLTIENIADESYTSETILPGTHHPYCLHNDQNFNSSGNYITLVKNCKFYSECDTPIGAGMNNKQFQRYENVECVYAANAVQQQQGAFYLHAPSGASMNPVGMEAIDCVFVSKNTRPAVSMGDVSGSTSWANIPMTFIRNVTYSAGGNEISIASMNALTPQSKGNSNSTLNAS